MAEDLIKSLRPMGRLHTAFAILYIIIPTQGSSSQGRADGCVAATCDTLQQINTLYCHSDPGRFCQCRPSAGNVWTLHVMTCVDPSTVFSFRHQVCVHPSLRDDADCSPQSDDVQDENVGDDDDETDDDGGNDDAVGCEAVPCGSFEKINTLSCHPDSKRFCQCRPIAIESEYPNRGVFEAIDMPCASGTSFSFRLQTCARDELWINTCP
ncbi:uncharacterized protein LOC134218555 [Armigeres subalbatus]|uniref:uncharacterized protein LOC134218555 n=1 Tax=Armigeres subalbatus TaxID=124917 RepID=UPI002ED63FE5